MTAKQLPPTELEGTDPAFRGVWGESRRWALSPIWMGGG